MSDSNERKKISIQNSEVLVSYKTKLHISKISTKLIRSRIFVHCSKGVHQPADTQQTIGARARHQSVIRVPSANFIDTPSPLSPLPVRVRRRPKSTTPRGKFSRILCRPPSPQSIARPTARPAAKGAGRERRHNGC